MGLRIRPKMVFAFLLMAIIFFVVALLAIYYSNQMQDSSGRMLTENVSSLKAAEELEIALLDMKGLTAYYLLDGDEQWQAIFNDKQRVFKEWFDEALNRTYTDEERKILTVIDSLYANYLENHELVIRLFRTQKKAQAVEILTIDMRENFNKIFVRCEQLLALNEMLMFNTHNLIKRYNTTINIIMSAVGFLGILLGLALGIGIARSITHPLYEIVLKMKDITDQEIIEKIDIRKETELQNLDEYVKKLIGKIISVNKDLKQSRNLLIRSEKLAALGRIASGLAHEIRNPLTAIKMLIFSMQDEFKNKVKTQEDFNVIIKEINRLEKFLQNFLDFARPPKPSFSMTNITEIIDNTIHLLSVQLKNNRIHVRKIVAQPGVKFLADKEQLQQVMINLLLNAIQSMPEGGNLIIRQSMCKSKTKEPDILNISITDTGHAIPEDILDSIFDPFVSGKEDGTGLGLSIAHQIMVNHNGWIEARNNPDRGATLSVNFKIKKGDDQ
jgi:signal transduction histidine kinase